jgi:hypothetical protein
MRKHYIFYSINTFLVVIGLLLLFFIANFWLGTQGQHEQLIASSKMKYFFGRLSMNIIASLAFVLFLWLLNILLIMVFKLDSLKIARIIIMEFVIFVFLSMIFIIIGM